jgi:hypothetical protein
MAVAVSDLEIAGAEEDDISSAVMIEISAGDGMRAAGDRNRLCREIPGAGGEQFGDTGTSVGDEVGNAVSVQLDLEYPAIGVVREVLGGKRLRTGRSG